MRVRLRRVPILAAIWAAMWLTGCGGPPNLEGYFLYTADDSADGPAGIYIATANGKNAKPLLPDTDALSPRWDAAGKRIYYTTDFGAGREVAAYDLTTNEIVAVTDHQPLLAAEYEAEQARRAAVEAQLPPDPLGRIRRGPTFVRYDLSFPSPTPDGRFVAYTVLKRMSDFAPLYRGDVYVGPAARGRPHRIAADLFTPDWLPGGHVGVASARGRIVKHDFGGDPMAGEFDMAGDRIYSDRSGQGDIQGARTSADGSQVAWVQGQSLSVAATDGSGEATVLATQKNFKLPSPGILPVHVAWSPDGQYIAVMAGLERNYKQGGIFVFRADGKPVYKSTRSFPVQGITARVDAFDWIASMD